MSDDEDHIRDRAFDILERWSEECPTLRGYYARATGGVDAYRIIGAADLAIERLRGDNAILRHRLSDLINRLLIAFPNLDELYPIRAAIGALEGTRESVNITPRL